VRGSVTGGVAGGVMRGPLRVRNFRLLGIGQFTSTVGDLCYAVALPWFILSAHGGTVLLGTVLACYGVPRTVLIPVGGMLADRLSPRLVMLAADAVRAVLVAVMALLAARGLAELAFLGPVAALLGAGEGVFLPASMAIVPSVLPDEMLQAGNGLSAALMQAGSIGGPVLGGILVTAVGPAPAFAIDAGSFAASALSLALMRGTARTPASARAAEAAEAAGETSVWRLFLRSRVLQVVVVVAVLANLVISGADQVALPALAYANFGATGYGALIACFGTGALAGTLTAARMSGLRSPAVGACLAFLIGSLAIAVVPFAGGLPGAAAAFLVFGAAGQFGNVVVITLLQRWAPAHMLGRVMGLVMLASLGSFPVAVALSGVIVRAAGPVPFFPASGIMLALTIGFALSQRQFRRFGVAAGAPADPADQAAAVTR
jgi:MFS family permease